MMRHTDSYQIRWTGDHFINASCKIVDCPQFLNGWVTRVIIGSPQEQYVKRDKSRKWTAVKVDDATMEYYYEAGQNCFGTHRMKLEKAPYFNINGLAGKDPRSLTIDFDEWTDRFNESSYRSTRR